VARKEVLVNGAELEKGSGRERKGGVLLFQNG
jgi:hypothetical protein